MENNKTDLEVTFKELVAALLDAETPFTPQYLYRLSDLTGDELAQFQTGLAQHPYQAAAGIAREPGADVHER